MKKRNSLLVSVLLILSAIAITFHNADIKNNSTPSVSTASYSDSENYVEMIDVNQGDCSLIVSEQYSMLIDCGEQRYSQNVIDTLNSKGINTLDLVIISHPHTDHMGALYTLLDNVEVKALLIDTTSPEDENDSTAYNKIIDKCLEQDVEILARDQYESIDFNQFHLELLPEYPTPDDENDRSIIIRASYKGSVFLFTGDMTSDYEEYLLEQNIDLSCDVLKVAHHGSKYSNCDEFLEAANPSICVIGAGADNMYGHPHQETLERIHKITNTIYRTDINGNITINADTLAVKTQ